MFSFDDVIMIYQKDGGTNAKRERSRFSNDQQVTMGQDIFCGLQNFTLHFPDVVRHALF